MPGREGVRLPPEQGRVRQDEGTHRRRMQGLGSTGKEIGGGGGGSIKVFPKMGSHFNLLLLQTDGHCVGFRTGAFCSDQVRRCEGQSRFFLLLFLNNFFSRISASALPSQRLCPTATA